jgi:hypothetical protein
MGTVIAIDCAAGFTKTLGEPMIKAVMVAVVLVGAMTAASPAVGAGRVIVAHDEWPLSDYGFDSTAGAEPFALNVARFFTGGTRSGRFLVYSTNEGLTGAALATTMRAAGHTWVVKDPAAAPLENFSQYDAVFVGQDSVNARRLTDYVNAGGGVYVMSGTGYGVADSNWNAFLVSFGLKLAVQSNNVQGVTEIHSSHPLFQGVNSLLSIVGNSVSVSSEYPGGAVVASEGAEGLFGVFTALEVSVNIKTAGCSDTVTLRRDSTGKLNVTIYGSPDLSTASIDPATVRLLDVRPTASNLVGGLLTAAMSVVCLTPADGMADAQFQFDAQKVATTIWRELGNTVVDGEVVIVTLSGRLKPEHGGGAIRGHDTLILRTR